MQSASIPSSTSGEHIPSLNPISQVYPANIWSSANQNALPTETSEYKSYEASMINPSSYQSSILPSTAKFPSQIETSNSSSITNTNFGNDYRVPTSQANSAQNINELNIGLSAGYGNTKIVESQSTASKLDHDVHERAHHPHIDVSAKQNTISGINAQTGVQEEYVTPYAKPTMHEQEVLKTPKKHERILEEDADLFEPQDSHQKEKRSHSSTTKFEVKPDKILTPYRNTMYPEFELVQDLPNRSGLVNCINNILQKSASRETLLTMPSRVSILRKSPLSPAKIEVECLLKEKYEDGSIYEGEGKKGLRHGQGKIFYSDGMTFEGEFNEGKMHGFGTLRYKNGKICYEGEYIDDKFEGQGELHNEAPMELIRPFDYRNFLDLGDYWLKYVGDFKEDKKHGVGTLYLMNGEKYYGEFQDDKIHGKGVFYLIDGSSITGLWEDNEFKERY